MTPQGPAPRLVLSQYKINVEVFDQQTSLGSSSGHQYHTDPIHYNAGNHSTVEAHQNIVFSEYDAGVASHTSHSLEEGPQQEAVVNEVVSVAYELPGADWYPGHVSSRNDDEGSWMKGRFEAVIVGGQRFTAPLELLKHIPKWRPLSTGKAPAQGLLMPDEDPKIFAVLLECVYSPSGFNGTEAQLNMVKLTLAMVLASRWGMFDEITKLDHSLRRYVARRVLFRQPFKPDFAGILDWNYFKYRSEEIYRTWDLCQRHESLQMTVSIPRLVALYATAIPYEMWPALTPDMEPGFTQLIDAFAVEHHVPDAGSFVQWWFKFFKEADCVDYPWFGHDGARYMFDRCQGLGEEDEDLDDDEQSEFYTASSTGDAGEAAYAEPATRAPSHVHRPTRHYYREVQHFDEASEYVQQITRYVEADVADPFWQTPQADDAAPKQHDAPIDVLNLEDERARQQ